MSALTREKLSQAGELIAQTDLDAWITFVRETALGGDPVLPLILDGGLTWQSALIVFRDGRKVAVVGNYDADPLKASGDWDEVIPYVQSIREPLAKVLSDVKRLGANFSTNDVKSDGLSHGMWLLLKEIVPHIELVTAEPLVSALRGVKTETELARIRKAIRATDEVFADVLTRVQRGISERDVYDYVHELARRRGYGFSWDPEGDPIVNSGPDSMIGHGIPSSEIQVSDGHVFHIDLGLIVDGYSSDIQRCWYVGSEVPDEVDAAIRAVAAAIQAGFDALKPGIEGWTVDAAARQSIVSAGYPEYLHALGHQVGRVAHDGGTILGPKWDRYGQTPFGVVREGEIYTLELGVTLPERGYIGLEEMVRVGSHGAEWLSRPQKEMALIP